MPVCICILCFFSQGLIVSLFFAGVDINIKDSQPWSVLVVTTTMKRVHALVRASELIFIDSSSSCDAMHSSVTTFLAATQVGAVPIAILIHSGQTTESYETSFRLLQELFPNCFGGNMVRINMGIWY